MRTKGLPSWPMALLCSGRLEMSPSATRARVAAAGPSLGGMASEVGSVGGCFDFQPGAAGFPTSAKPGLAARCGAAAETHRKAVTPN